MEQVPKSVNILAPFADYFCELNNSPKLDDIELVTPGISWVSFKDNWEQTCAWVPRKKKLQNSNNQCAIVSPM